MTDLVVIVPSRDRPAAVRELAEVFAATCTADSELLVSVDADAPQLSEYRDIAASAGPTVALVVGDNSNMVEALNRAAASVTSYAVGFMGDDHRPRTKGWDAAYLEALRELGTGIVYGNDLLQGERLPTQAAMTTDIVQALGFMAPVGLRHMYVDNFWLDLGRASGCLRYLPNVIVEHVHPFAQKAAMDAGYARVNAPEVYSADERAYRSFLVDEMPGAIAAVQALRGNTFLSPSADPSATLPTNRDDAGPASK